MPTSNASEPLMTSAGSPDTLPITGYSIDALANYVLRKLNSPVWSVELTKQQILDNIQDALGLYSQYVPNIKVGSLPLSQGQFKYLQGENVGLGIVQVDFVERNALIPVDLSFGGIINMQTLFRTGLDELDMYLRWQKTWQRVTSVKPDWYYDEMEQALYVHNPISRYRAGIFCYWPHERTEKLSYTGANWVKRYALAASQLQLGDLFMKFSGIIPAPAQNIQLDQQKRQLAQTEVDKLMALLVGMQRSATPSID